MQFHSHPFTRLVTLAVLAMMVFGVEAAAQRLDFEFAIEAEADRAVDGAQRVHSDHIFRSGDRFRIAFSSKFDAFVYLFSRGDAESGYTRLFPHAAVEASNRVRPGYEVRVPDQGGWLQLDNKPGMERLVLVVSNRPQTDLEEIGAEVERDRLERVVAQLGLTRSPGRVNERQQDGWTRLRFEGRPSRIVHVKHLTMMHHTR